MTIQIPDLYLRLQEQSSYSSWPSDSEDLIRLRKKALALTTASKDNDDFYEDCCTLSTTSLSDLDSIEEELETGGRCRVSFAEDLVTDVWTRSYTEPKEVADLFYSSSEIERFRQEFRMERKLLSSLNEDSEDLFLLDQPRARKISRVVVLHNDKLETFSSNEDSIGEGTCNDVDFDTPEFWSGSITWW